MPAVGSYVLSINERPGGEVVDLKTACARLLKLLGPKTAKSFGELLSLTGFSEVLLKDALEQLRNDKLVTGPDTGVRLTDLGYKAHFIVAT